MEMSPVRKNTAAVYKTCVPVIITRALAAVAEAQAQAQAAATVAAVGSVPRHVVKVTLASKIVTPHQQMKTVSTAVWIPATTI